jgi:hypothetical protein
MKTTFAQRLKHTPDPADIGKIKKSYFIKPNKLPYGFPFWELPNSS